MLSSVLLLLRKEYYDQMTVADAIETIDLGFDRIRNDGQYFSIDRDALYKFSIYQLNNKGSNRKIIK